MTVVRLPRLDSLEGEFIAIQANRSGIDWKKKPFYGRHFKMDAYFLSRIMFFKLKNVRGKWTAYLEGEGLLSWVIYGNACVKLWGMN